MKRIFIFTLLTIFIASFAWAETVRVICKPDGSISVIHPALKSKKANEIEQEWLKRIFDKATPKGLEYKDIDSSQLPQSREDRMAWEWDKEGKKVKVNQVKAQRLRKQKERTRLIEEEKKRILEQQAIDNLKAQGFIN